MHLTLTDIGSIASIASLLLTLLFRRVTRERFKDFWTKWFWPIVFLLAVAWLWRAGFLGGLHHPVTWPVWALVATHLFCFAVGLGAAIVCVWPYRPQVAVPPFYEFCGARWEMQGGQFRRPPVCAQCLMEMRNLAMPSWGVVPSEEVWECRQCGHTIRWDQASNGDLLENVRIRYEADLRKRAEGQSQSPALSAPD